MLLLTYDSIVSALQRVGINPFTRGDNEIEAQSVRIDTYKKPFDLSLIGFPEFEKEQISKIGEILNNLVSFKRKPGSSLSLSGAEMDKRLNAYISFLKDSLEEWLSFGLNKSSEKRNLICYNGYVYEINPEYFKKMDKMNKHMQELRRDFRQKEAASEESARKIVFTD